MPFSEIIIKGISFTVEYYILPRHKVVIDNRYSFELNEEEEKRFLRNKNEKRKIINEKIPWLIVDAWFLSGIKDETFKKQMISFQKNLSLPPIIIKQRSYGLM